MGRLARSKERKHKWRAELKKHKVKLKDQKKRFQLRPVKFPTKNLDMYGDESSNANSFADTSIPINSKSHTPDSEEKESMYHTFKQRNRKLNIQRKVQMMQQQSNDKLSVHERIDELCGRSKKKMKKSTKLKKDHFLNCRKKNNIEDDYSKDLSDFLSESNYVTKLRNEESILSQTSKKNKKKPKKRGKKRPKGVAGLILAELRQNPVHRTVEKSMKTMQKNKDKLKKNDNNDDDDDGGGQMVESMTTTTEKRITNILSKKKKSKKDRLVSHLDEAQFRYLNEVLYTTSGSSAFEMMQKNREDFENYHDTYNVIVEGNWPESPLLLIYKQLCRYMRETEHLSNAPVIADFGCGDAKLAAAFYEYSRQSRRYSNVKVHSFDLVALNDFVTECDMAHTTLDDCSVDMAVFCLSLMGNNFHEYLMEAHRVLKPMGLLKIAEVKSRMIGHTTKRFRGFLELCGFKVLKENDSNTHFVLLDCVKSITKKCKVTRDFDPQTVLKPCLYKKR